MTHLENPYGEIWQNFGGEEENGCIWKIIGGEEENGWKWQVFTFIKAPRIRPNPFEHYKLIPNEWQPPYSLKPIASKSRQEWLAARWLQAMQSLDKCVDVDPGIRGGIPVLKGTRITIARILADIADGYCIHEIAEEMDLDESLLAELLDGLSSCLNRPF